MIRDGDHDDIGAEKLRGLLKILPELDELEMLRAFDGDKSKLGNAEKFLLQLIDIPKYKKYHTFDLQYVFALKLYFVYKRFCEFLFLVTSYALKVCY